MIRAEHLVKRYGRHLAVDDVSFEVDKGEVVGFLGPNGAGKSTTLRILSGFLGMTSGKVTIAGHDIGEAPLDAKKKIGYMPEAVPLYPEMRVAEYLAFRAELKAVPRGKRRSRIDDAMQKAKVSDRATTLIGHLSKGYRQRVGLADALVADPPLLILDEPTSGLDPNQIREVRSVIKGLGKDHTVLLSTHILSEVEASCSRVLVIAKGKLVAKGTTAEIRKLRRPPGLRVRVAGEVAPAIEIVSKIEGVTKVEAEDGSLIVRFSKKLSESATDTATEQIVAALVSASIGVRGVRPVESTLEEVFADLTVAEPDEEGTEEE